MTDPKLPTRDNRWYGRRADIGDPRDFCFADAQRHLLSAPIPPTVDLRTTGCVPPVYDQGALGSCVGNATAAAYAYDQKRQGRRRSKPSRLFVYYGARQIEGSVASDSGCEIRDGMKTLANLGAPHETLWPYKIASFAKRPSIRAYWDGEKHQALTYLRVANTPTDTQLAAALAGGFPVVIGISVFESFESTAVATTGIVPMPSRAEQLLGGHCMYAIGYETTPSGRVYRVRNSWGVWGDAGDCHIPAAYLTNPDLASDFWTLSSVE